MTKTRIIRSTLITVLFALSVAGSCYIYVPEDAIPTGLGEAGGALLGGSFLGWAWARWRRTPMPWTAVIVFAILSVMSNVARQLPEAVDWHRFKAEMAGVPPAQIQTALQKSDTVEGRYLASLLSISGAHQQQVQAILLEAEDPALEYMLEPARLGDKASRSAILPIIEAKRTIVAGMMDRIDHVVDDLVAQASALPAVSSDPSSKQRGDAVFAKAAARSRQQVKNYVDWLYAFYADVGGLLQFLDTPAGTPTLGQDGRLYFATDDIVKEFNARVDRIYDDRAKGLQALQNLQAIPPSEQALRKALDG